ncbi:putative nucleotide di-P-sugar epimerase or dehydratase [Pseudooceanicola batsensis HTCC2597]|uniref:GDP-L-fucose synthase n=1 Tax=Pseudooceanicola batsensis (strain ATCC BAA-863 / DSM 15984 / KCTC 12145 / HTCC2597) TaxID=252305 RepID=A3TUU7_PSEBH|nr:GDP-L-fucose synthase [Pseudooceanicola batsensis]EAQ04293.1 putative nucleotide di-P-sugar epimerase or dehydratase [Pseudooceanicola batsensis HTCC2597]
MKIYLAGHEGMAGAAILRQLRARDARVVTRTHAQLDLTNQLAVRQFMRSERPDVVILAAGRSGGIQENDRAPAEFLYENMMIEANVIHQAWAAGVRSLLLIAAASVYPKAAVQPMRETALLSGQLDQTLEPQAIARIAGMKMCEAYTRQHGTDFRCVVPASLYGPGDDFDAATASVLPGLIRRFDEAVRMRRDSVAIWGTGKVLREFLHVDDMASGALFVLDLDRADFDAATAPRARHLNIGSGTDLSIRDLARVVARVTGFSGRLTSDTTQPDGAPRRLLECTGLTRLGWRAAIPLEEGIRATYDWFLSSSDATARAS